MSPTGSAAAVPKDSPRGGALPALTGARFFAAASVVVYHFGRESLSTLSPALVSLGAVGPAAVSFFYVLSGAVLTWGCTGPDRLPSRSSKNFWQQRFARVAPAYLFALFLSLAPFIAEVHRVHRGPGELVRIALGIFFCTLALQAFFPPLSAGFNTPGWSISCEGFFYSLWPRLVRALRSDRPGLPWGRGLLLWLIGMLSPALGVALLHFDVLPSGSFATLTAGADAGELLARTLSYFPLFRLPEFAIGIALGHALRSTPARIRSTTADSLRELFLSLALLAIAFALGSGVPQAVTGQVLANRIAIEGGLLAPIFALWVWQLARGEGVLAKLLSRRGLVALGEASYALYILQEPVEDWLTGGLKRIWPAAMDDWYWIFWLYFAALIGLSLAVHRMFELPMRGWLLRRFARRPPAI